MEKRTYNHSIEEILNNKDTIYVFDVDGTLTDFNYELRAFAQQIEEVPTDYKKVRPLKTMQKFVATLDKDKVYVCSRSIFLEENRSKTEFLVKHFDIKPSNIFFVENNEQKIDVFKFIQKETGAEDEFLLVIEDNALILDKILEKTNYSNLHVTYFVD